MRLFSMLAGGILLLGVPSACVEPPPAHSSLDGSGESARRDAAPTPLDQHADARPSPGHGPPYPIVLVHGFFGLFFWQVPQALTDAGFVVHEARIDPFNNSEARGEQLPRWSRRCCEARARRR